MSEKLSGQAMRELVIEAAGGISGFDSRPRLFRRAATQAGVTYRQARALFYGEISDEDHKTVRRMKAAATAAKAAKEAAEARREARDLAATFERIAHGLRNGPDADFHSTDVAALIDAARALRGLDRSRADE